MAAAPEVVLRVVDAEELKSGGIYAITIPAGCSEFVLERVMTYFRDEELRLGGRFLILEDSMKISAIRPAGIEEIESAVGRALAKHQSLITNGS